MLLGPEPRVVLVRYTISDTARRIGGQFPISSIQIIDFLTYMPICGLGGRPTDSCTVDVLRFQSFKLKALPEKQDALFSIFSIVYSSGPGPCDMKQVEI